MIYINECDNRSMLPEIKLIYQALEVQIHAGIYATDALTECCQSVRQRRLQQALMELAGDLVMQSDTLTALSDFQEKFDNRQIDALCITLIQAGESGQAVELFQDMGEQLKESGADGIKTSEERARPQYYVLSAGNARRNPGGDPICLCGIHVPGGSEILNRSKTEESKKSRKKQKKEGETTNEKSVDEKVGTDQKNSNGICSAQRAGNRRNPGNSGIVHYCTAAMCCNERQSDSIHTDHCDGYADESCGYSHGCIRWEQVWQDEKGNPEMWGRYWRWGCVYWRLQR